MLSIRFECSRNFERNKTDPPRMSNDKTPIDTTGWTSIGPGHWRDAQGGDLVITSSAPSSDLKNVDWFRDKAPSEILSGHGGLVSADVADGIGVVVAKFPQQPSGMTYEGALVFVRDRSEYRVTIRFPEKG